METVNREIDGLGRIIIPYTMRETLGIKENDLLSINVEGTKITLEKVL